MSESSRQFPNWNARSQSPPRREPARKAVSADPISVLDAGHVTEPDRLAATAAAGV
jgi:hypothetical protein